MDKNGYEKVRMALDTAELQAMEVRPIPTPERPNPRFVSVTSNEDDFDPQIPLNALNEAGLMVAAEPDEPGDRYKPLFVTAAVLPGLVLLDDLHVPPASYGHDNGWRE